MAASAIDDPVTPLISVESAIEVCASPPCMRPVSTVASFSRLVVMPELLRKLPARMNSGTASRAKFCVSVTVTWIGMVAGNSGCCRKNSVPEMPMAKAIGMPSSSRTVKAIRTISMGPFQPRHQQRGVIQAVHSTSAALSSTRSPCSTARTFNSVVMSRSMAPTGRLMVTHE